MGNHGIATFETLVVTRHLLVFFLFLVTDYESIFKSINEIVTKREGASTTTIPQQRHRDGRRPHGTRMTPPKATWWPPFRGNHQHIDVLLLEGIGNNRQ